MRRHRRRDARRKPEPEKSPLSHIEYADTTTRTCDAVAVIAQADLRIVECLPGLAVLEQFDIGSLIVDADGHVQALSNAAARVLGQSDATPPTVFSLSAVSESHDADRIRELLEEIVASGLPRTATVTLAGRIWELRGLLVAGSRSRIAILVIGHNEERKQNGSDRLSISAALPTPLAFAFHDLRNPLTAILTAAGCLQQCAGLNGEANGCVSDILEAARQMDSMVADLRDVALAGTGALELQKSSVNLTALASGVAHDFSRLAETEGQRVIFTSPRTDCVATVDGSLIKRVLQNLLANCIRFNASNGIIRMSLEPGPDDAFRLNVRDEGSGVEPSRRKLIFEGQSSDPTRTDSRGVGLRFCSVVMALHGGRIWVEENLPHGACFAVEVPAH